MILTATLSDTTATVMNVSGNSDVKPGGSGFITDVELLSSADTTIALTISDGISQVFSVSSADFTTITKYKNDNAAILRNGKEGQLTATATGIGTGTLTVRVFLKQYAN